LLVSILKFFPFSIVILPGNLPPSFIRPFFENGKWPLLNQPFCIMSGWPFIEKPSFPPPHWNKFITEKITQIDHYIAALPGYSRLLIKESADLFNIAKIHAITWRLRIIRVANFMPCHAMPCRTRHGMAWHAFGRPAWFRHGGMAWHDFFWSLHRHGMAWHAFLTNRSKSMNRHEIRHEIRSVIQIHSCCSSKGSDSEGAKSIQLNFSQRSQFI
jgi:hypothetical protein